LGTIDLGFLGMGSDGHTAGFFTPEQANLKTGALTLHTDRPDGMQGVSVTPALFHWVERIILLVTGESKRGIIGTFLTRPETIPAGIALSGHHNIELWTDVKM
jgi:6-phosphogluconolactonase/glucosamine-6-phosphate isomerase/deaminase